MPTPGTPDALTQCVMNTKAFAIVLAAFLAACSGNGEAPVPEPKPAPAAAEEEKDPTLTKREVDQQLDEIEQEIESGNVDQRVVVAE
jgi:hypothetical protein